MLLGKYLSRPRSVMRRKDRRLDAGDWQHRLLAMTTYGTLAAVHDGQPVIHGNIFWHDPAANAIYLHQARVGRLRAIADLGPSPASFMASDIGRIIPNYTPLEFSVEYASVIAYGTLAPVTDLDEARRALEGLMTKYAPQLEPGRDYDPMPLTDIKQTTVLKLAIDELVGKHNVKPADYAPYRIPPYPLPQSSFIDEERTAGRVTIAPKELG
jgi:nitroimidazol reductase NimA-like FMN-containing flavoprotein (pyridoxamine 5'-phosphate oxidase superfamily)